jgi:hypothetical protein
LIVKNPYATLDSGVVRIAYIQVIPWCCYANRSTQVLKVVAYIGNFGRLQGLKMLDQEFKLYKKI